MSFLLKLAKDRPSWTIQVQPGPAIGPFHWESRRLSWREMAALQTFPPGFRISAPQAEIQRQIGNAVPLLLAEALGRSLGVQVAGARAGGPPRLAVRRKGDIPPPERIQPVPEEYLRLIGVHPSHTGTGRGAFP
ncbi:MAG: DNA cytosine methyltransferase [Deltaproteobacteria bacterium]|nr:DNA cytosine methyltransferase [Deltaproteobacteria bacterium]